MDHCSYPSSTFFHATPYPQASTARDDFILGRSLLFMNPHTSLYHQFTSTRITPTSASNACVLLSITFTTAHLYDIFYHVIFTFCIHTFPSSALCTCLGLWKCSDILFSSPFIGLFTLWIFFTTSTPHGFFMYC